MNAQELMYSSAGNQPLEKFKTEPHEGLCATCGSKISDGVPNKEIAGTTFSQHADFLRFGTHICVSCAWLYQESNLGNVIALGNDVYRPLIAVDAAREQNRMSWRGVFREAATREVGTPVAGILTTDVKPRFFPRVRMASIKQFGLYVHCPDYDVSEYRTFDLIRTLELIDVIQQALKLGFSKRACFFGLMRDFKRAQQQFESILELESRLQMARLESAFIPALLASSKETE
jgi:hypothetical protein